MAIGDEQLLDRIINQLENKGAFFKLSFFLFTISYLENMITVKEYFVKSTREKGTSIYKF
jgi:hypothetical protein